MPIVFLITLIIFALGIIIYNFFARRFIDKKNLFFFIPLFALLMGLYIYAYIDKNGSLNYFNLIKCIKNSLDCFIFKVDSEILLPAINNDAIFAVDVYFAISFASLTTISGVLGLFKIGLVNNIATFTKMHFRQVDIVIGDPSLVINYCLKNKNSLMWVDSRKNRLTREEKTKYYTSKINYINRPLSGQRIKFATALNTNYIHIIILQKKNEYLTDVIDLIPELNNNRKNGFRIHVQTSGELLSFIDSKLSESCQKVNNVAANSFDIYELIARTFSNEHNLAYYLPRDIFQEGTVDSNKEINVVMLGFGKTSNAVFRSLVINNQFVEIVKNKYQAKKVNYYLYDVDDKRFESPIISYLRNIDLYRRNEDGLNPCELPCEIKCNKINVKASTDKDFLSRFKLDDNQFNFYFISLKDGIENASIAEHLFRIVNKDKSIIFYNVDTKEEIFNHMNNNLIPYGFKNDMLNHNHITNDNLWELSTINNRNYLKMKNEKDEKVFKSRPVIEKLSNAYSVINYRFKLNVLGLDYSTNKDNMISKEEYYSIYDKDNKRNTYNLDTYFSINTRTALAYQEHLRWSIFYTIYGYTYLSKEDIRVQYDGDNVKVIHKDPLRKKHACLVNYYDLKDIIDYEMKYTKDFAKSDCYKYDYVQLDNLYDTLKEAGYYIKKL